MPSRLIKETIHSSDHVNAMTDFQFRLWVNLITYVDDYGRGDARAAIIKGTCFPLRDRLTNKDIESALAGLAGIGCVGLYEVDGKPYLYFPNWEKHQTIRNKRSKFPEPPADLQASANICKQMQANSPVIQSESISESNNESITEEPPYIPPKGDAPQKPKAKFSPPSVEDVRAYCQQSGIVIDAEQFVDFYASKGWKVGREPMKDWKAAVRNWARRDRETVKTPKQTKNGMPVKVERLEGGDDLERLERLMGIGGGG